MLKTVQQNTKHHYVVASRKQSTNDNHEQHFVLGVDLTDAKKESDLKWIGAMCEWVVVFIGQQM